MKKWLISIFAFAALPGSVLFAQEKDISGTWQGTLEAGRELRIVIKISKVDDGGFKAAMYSIDQGGQAIAGTVAEKGADVKISIPGIGGTYEGKLDPDGLTLAGTWSQGPKPLPLNLKHVTGDAAWAIPAPPPRLKPMAADAPMSFEVATIKPSKPGAQGKGITMQGPRQFATINTTMNDLVSFAYGVQERQIVGAPSWFDSDHFDIQAEPEAEGMPNRKQLEAMLKKLLTDRFKLAFHREKKELSVYAIVVGKGGPKMTKSAGDPNGLPGLFFRGLGSMVATNSNMSDLAGLFQSSVLDRPVVDQTELSGRFDFTLRWTPDDTQFASFGPRPKVATEDPNAPPDLFAAIQEQLGLRLVATKAPVDVLVIDHVEKPSGN